MHCCFPPSGCPTRVSSCSRPTRPISSSPSMCSSRRPTCCTSTTRSTPACSSARRPCWTRAATKRPAATGEHWCWTPHCRSETTRTTIRTTCRSSAPRADRAASRVAARCPMSHRTGRCAISSRTPGSAPAWTGGPTPASASRPGPTTSRSPEPCRSRRASATCSAGLHRDRSRIPVPRPTVPTCTRRTAPRSGRDCRPRLRRAHRVTPAATPGSEPFVVPAPAQMQPTPLPPVPLPREAAPSP